MNVPRVCGRPALLVVVAALLESGCLRAPISDETFEDTELDGESSGTTDEILPTTGDDTSTGGGVPQDCHPSYVPCLPVVDDLNCDDVRALGAAPVEIVGEDDYFLDADHDGIGCET